MSWHLGSAIRVLVSWKKKRRRDRTQEATQLRLVPKKSCGSCWSDSLSKSQIWVAALTKHGVPQPNVSSSLLTTQVKQCYYRYQTKRKGNYFQHMNFNLQLIKPKKLTKFIEKNSATVEWVAVFPTEISHCFSENFRDISLVFKCKCYDPPPNTYNLKIFKFQEKFYADFPPSLFLNLKIPVYFKIPPQKNFHDCV